MGSERIMSHEQKQNEGQNLRMSSMCECDVHVTYMWRHCQSVTLFQP
jgi:hypothetical protein